MPEAIGDIMAEGEALFCGERADCSGSLFLSAREFLWSSVMSIVPLSVCAVTTPVLESFRLNSTLVPSVKSLLQHQKAHLNPSFS